MPSAVNFSELCDMKEMWRNAILESALPSPDLSRALSRIDSGEQDETDFRIALGWGLLARRQMQDHQNAAARFIPGWQPSREMLKNDAFVGDVLLRAEMGRCRRN